MTFRLRIPAQVGDWLADLRESEPEAATEVAAALVALIEAEEVPGPPLVTNRSEVEAPDARQALDYAYQQLLEGFQRVRRRVGDAASRRHGLDLELGQLRAMPDTDPALVAELERQAVVAARVERELTRLSQRLQMRINRFRTQKEAAKAVYTAAAASQEIQAATKSLGAAHDQDVATAAEAVRQAGLALDQVLAQADGLRQDVLTAADLADRSTWIQEAGPSPHSPASEGDEGESASKPDDGDHPGHGPADPDATAVLELNADPLGAQVRMLFAIEPVDTVTLLTVLEGAAAIRNSADEAMRLAGELLAEVRAAGSPPADDADDDWHEFACTAPFLEWLSADRAAAIAERAAALAAATSLAAERERRGMTLAALARATGMSGRRLAAIERDGLRSAAVFEVAAYVRALGGRLELAAVVDGERRDLA